MTGNLMNETPNHRLILITGFLGIAAAILVGTGEFLLHYSPAGDYADDGNYVYLLNVPEWRITWGHFLAMSGAPLYLIGYWHMYLGLRPYGKVLPLLVFFVSSYGFMFGAVWIGSRAGIALLAQAHFAAEGHNSDVLRELMDFYILHSESLLQVIRITTLVSSFAFIIMVLTGKTLYPRWMAIFNPIVLLLLSFVLFAVAPEIGKYTLPIALNMGYFIFFSLSTLQLARICKLQNKKGI
jgi:Family of unknown function (DUF6796)